MVSTLKAHRRTCKWKTCNCHKCQVIKEPALDILGVESKSLRRCRKQHYNARLKRKITKSGIMSCSLTVDKGTSEEHGKQRQTGKII